MLDPARRRAPRVFLSYASDDSFWVSAFTQNEWFGSQLGNVVVEDYLKGHGLPFGSLAAWVKERTSGASVVMAFVSQAYTRSKWAEVEWQKSLGEHKLRELLFVPGLLDADSKLWWMETKRRGDLQDLAADYQYSDFTENGSRLTITKEDGRVIGKIVALAHAIRAALAAKQEN